ncbi:hypothetical protein [Litorilituus sediminis]|uniref:hypothetical protein n=1 Tax=Litorilituus sediminis TaxID=718192 RepID=UPI001477781D|nr:hypothetical protein [Litorilituus sediminis]
MIFGIDVKVITALIALLGVLLASALSAGAYFYKVKAEAKKVLENHSITYSRSDILF